MPRHVRKGNWAKGLNEKLKYTFTPSQGRIGKCKCGGELSSGEVENDYVINVKCNKCKKKQKLQHRVYGKK
jgi:hypothetical protein